jgi:hypothetical protein
VEVSSPLMVPGLGAVSGMVKTMGSGIGGAPGAGREGVMLDVRGKRM